MGTRKTSITVHDVPADISEDRMGAFFAKYREVDEVGVVMSKFGIVLQGNYHPTELWRDPQRADVP